MAGDPEHPYVGRGGLKLQHALDAFGLDVTDLDCADLGCSTGGFTDCLLQRGVNSVVCVDTAYGELAWKLRQDERTVVMERTNVLHTDPIEGGVDLVVMDLGWTPQRLAIPAAAKWLRPGGRIISLIKPHYELSDRQGKGAKIVLDEDQALQVTVDSIEALKALGYESKGLIKSPILGGGSRSKSAKRGNPEWLALIELAG